MKEKIIKLLAIDQKMKAYQLMTKLGLNNLDQLNEVLKEMSEELLIARSINDVVYLLDKTYKRGTVKLNQKGFGFIGDIKDLSAEEYFIPPIYLNGTFATDEVVYLIENEENGRQKAKIIDLITRSKEYIIGEMIKSQDGKFIDFIPNDKSFASFRMVIVNKNDVDLQENMIIKAKILESKERKMFIRVKKIIGNANKAADRIFSIAEEFDIRNEFQEKTLQNAHEVNTPIPTEVKNKRTKNSLLDKTIVTIDGIDSKDLDDAICVEKTPSGYKLFVAIADVSYYVKPKSPLDNEALFRGNSTYLANKVIPMLPEILSNKLCSLNPNEEKLVMVCEMDFDHNGFMKEKKVYESIMISKARLNYREINEYFKDETIWNHSNEVKHMINDANELHQLLNQIRKNKGAITFEVREAKVVMDQESNVVEIKARETGESERLIENFMVSANEAVAELIFEKELPFIYRNHPGPNEENLVTWYSNVRSFGIDVKMTDLEKTNPRNLNKALEQISSQISDPIEQELMNLSLLRYMGKAKYDLENIGHFGLASECYTHFTSPIRRYSDLIVHRYLKQYLIERDLREFTLERNKAFIEMASTIINDTEITSVDCEREVNKACMVEYMADKIGQVYIGTISIALKFGIFVQLDNMVEGLVHISNLDQGITYDEKSQTLIKPDNTFYRMGQKVKIKVMASDIKKRAIDFILV